MRVTVSASGGVSRALNLAAGFEARGVLRSLYVPFFSEKHPLLSRLTGRAKDVCGIAPEHVTTDVWVAVLRKLMMKTAARRLTRDPWLLWRQALDRRVARRLDTGQDVVLAESMVALETLKAAKRLGSVAVLDRTNTHVKHQVGLLAEEYERLGIVRGPWLSDEAVERGLAEYEEADFICVLSSFARDTFVAHGIPPEKLLVVPSGVSLADFKPRPKADDVFRIVFVGHLSIKKGSHWLLEACSKLGLPAAELWLVGSVDYEMRPFLQRYRGSYVLRGFVRHSQLPRELARCSVYVQPSLEEGLPKAVLEAMASGLPVIASQNAGVSDVLRDGVDGFIVPTRDTEALQDRITRLYHDPVLRRSMGASAAARVAEGFSWDAYTQRMVDALASAVSARSRHTG